MVAPSSSSSSAPTRIMVALSESRLRGYPYASMSSRVAFDWTFKKIIRSNTSEFKLILIHVQTITKNGTYCVAFGSGLLPQLAKGRYVLGNPIEEHPTEEQIQKYYEEERKKEKGPNKVMRFGSLEPVLIKREDTAGEQQKEKHRLTAPSPAVQIAHAGISDPATEEYKTLRIRSEENGLNLLDYFVKQCKKLGVACEALVVVGLPGQVICSEAACVQPDLIVVGNRGLNDFHRASAVRVSEYCIKNAHCPVIAIKRPVTLTPENPVDD